MRKGGKTWGSSSRWEQLLLTKKWQLDNIYLKCSVILCSQVSRLATDMVLTWKIFFFVTLYIYIKWTEYFMLNWRGKIFLWCFSDQGCNVREGFGWNHSGTGLYTRSKTWHLSSVLFSLLLLSYFLFVFTEFSLPSFTSEVNKNKPSCISGR